MILTSREKDLLKKELVLALSSQEEIQKIVVFGSFLKNKSPNDIDIAIFQNSDEKYLSLALKYRKITRKISKIIPLDIIPLRRDFENDFVSSEIESGEVIYEKRN